MAKTNAERQAEYRKRQREIGRCVTGGCREKAYPHRKCVSCRKFEADQKAAKRREVVQELQELDMLRERVQILRERNLWLDDRIALLEELVKILNNHHLDKAGVEGIIDSLEKPNDNAILKGLEVLVQHLSIY